MKDLRIGSVLALVGGLLVAAVFGWWWMRPAQRPLPTTAAERLQWVQSALAATEALDVERGAALWEDLRQAMPSDADSAVNRAIHRIVALQTSVRQEQDLVADAASRRAAGRRRPRLTAEATQAIDDVRQVAGAPTLAAWMEASIDLTLARREQAEGIGAVAGNRSRGAAERLIAAIASDPQAVFLAGPLADFAELLETPREGLPSDLVDELATAFETLSDMHPRNLFVALQAIRYAMQAERVAAARLVRRTAGLAEPLDELLRRATAPLGKSPQELAESVATSVEMQDWSRARSDFAFWQNVLVATEMVRSDRKLADPNPLDLLAFRTLHELSAQVSREQWPAAETAELRLEAGPVLGSEETGIDSPQVVAFIDFDLDDSLDLLVAGNGKLSLLANRAEGFVLDSIVESILEPRGLAVVDLFMVDGGGPARIRRSLDAEGMSPDQQASRLAEHETFPCIVVYGKQGVELWRVDGRTEAKGDRLVPPTEPTGLESIRDVTAVVAGDFDADGDLDLAIATAEQGLQIWINRGNMTFFPVASHSQMPAMQPPIVALAIADVDRDLDLDLITIDEAGQVGWLENLLHLQFRWRPVEWIDSPASVAANADGQLAAKGGKRVAICDADGNVSWDLAVLAGDRLRLGLTETTDVGIWQPLATRETVMPAETQELLLFDLDNDSWLDAILVGNDRVLVARGQPGGDFQTPVTLLNADTIRSVAACDIDLDGQVDLCIADRQGVSVFRNVTDSEGHFMAVRFKGIADNAADSGRVNHYAVGSTLEVRFGPHYRAAIVTDRTTHFGLDGYAQADSLRAILPNGLTHITIDPPVDAVFNEVQTLKGSCPYLYAWDGEKFAFITDCLWAAPLGLQFAPGEVLPDRPWEYLKVSADQVQARDGHYEFRVTEELWEIAYFDQIELLVIDHPEEIDVWTNEKVGSPDVEQHQLYTTASTRPVRQAIDSGGRDVTERLREVDQRYVQAFDRRLRQGLVPTHWIDLDLGEIDPGDRVLLLLTGWIFPTDTSLNLQIAQNPELPSLQFPSLWIPDGDGGWKMAIERMGFPGGKTKTIVSDVSEWVRPEDPRVRIRTSAQICWDAAFVAINPPAVHLQPKVAELVAAEVAWHGFSRELPRTEDAPHRYDYNDVSSTMKWPPLRGGFSRLGDCRELLLQHDDRLVVIGGGDEIRLRFQAPDPPPPGYKRDFILHLIGWDKDADLNTLAGQSVGPLPFQAMESYPPPPWQHREQRATDRSNAPHLTRAQRYRDFWNRPWAQWVKPQAQSGGD